MMNAAQLTRRSRRRNTRRTRLIRLTNVMIVVLVAVLAFALCVHAWHVFKPTNTPQAVETPTTSVATPLQAPSATPTPTEPTPTPAASAAPAPLNWQTWSFDWASLTVPKTTTPEVRAQYPNAVIDKAAITPLQPDELVSKPYINSAGQTALYEAIEPASKQGITWDTLTESTGGVLSAGAENTVYLYCHDYADNTALCSVVFDVLVQGDEIRLETATEILTYRLTDRFNVLKGDLSNDPRITTAAAQRLVLITCNSGGQRIDGDTVENSAMVFELASAELK